MVPLATDVVVPPVPPLAFHVIFTFEDGSSEMFASVKSKVKG